MKPVVVVKLGGSHAFSATLQSWLSTLATLSGKVVVVPGGGPFAQAVRGAQAEMAFDDRAAHRMALLAMEQYACAFCSLMPGLQLASSTAEIGAILDRGLVPVWCPAPMALADPEIEQSWAVTSDSLAAWLAGQLGARQVALVKQLPPPPKPWTVNQLVETGLVDSALPAMLSRFALELLIFGPDAQAEFAAFVRALP